MTVEMLILLIAASVTALALLAHLSVDHDDDGID